MGVLTLAQMKIEVRAGFGNSTEYDSRLNNLLTLAQDRLVAKHDFEELKVRDTFGTTANSGDASADMVIALPSLTRQVYSIALIDGADSRKLQSVPSVKWDAMIPYGEQFTRDKPTHYRRWGTNIELWRVPNGTYTLRGHRSKWATPFTTDEQTSDLDRKDFLLILLAQIWLAALIDRADRANYFWSIFKTIYEESFAVSIYKADLNKAGGQDMSATDNYWQNPFMQNSPTVD